MGTNSRCGCGHRRLEPAERNHGGGAVPRIAAAFFLVLTVVAAASTPKADFLAAFAPLTAGPAGISPAGTHVAYFERTENRPRVVILDLHDSSPGLEVALGRESKREWIGETAVVTPTEARFLRWADEHRLVVATSTGQFFVIDRIERRARLLIDLGQHSIRLVRSDGKTSQSETLAGPCTGQVVALQPGPPARLLVDARRYDTGEAYAHRLLTIDLKSGEAEATREVVVAGRLTYDPDGRVRGYSSASDAREGFFVAIPQNRGYRWQNLASTHPVAARPRSQPQGSDLFGPRSFPVGVAGDLLYFVSNVGRDLLGHFALDLNDGTTTHLSETDTSRDVAILSPGPPADTLVTDRASGRVVGLRQNGIEPTVHWLDPDLATVQRMVNARLHGSNPVLIDWDDAREQFILERRSRGDPGEILLFARASGKVASFVRLRTPSATTRAATSGWTLRRADGGSLTGWLTLPAAPTEGHARPVVVRLDSPAWTGIAPRPFDVVALAAMGYAVLEVHHRGVAGLGLAHLEAARGRLDVVVAEDIEAALDGLATQAGLDLSRVALFGTHIGGYLALRTTQLRPGRFAAAVTIEPSTDVALMIRRPAGSNPFHRNVREAFHWMFGTDEARWRAQSPVTAPAPLAAPVFIAANPRLYQYRWTDPLALRRRLQKEGNPPQYVEVTSGAHYHGREQAQLWEQIEAFLAARLARVEP